MTGVESAWKVPPYNVVLSRRHEPVEHNSTCARRLRRGERGVVVREILWGGRGVTNMAARKDGCRLERAVQTASREPSSTGVGGWGQAAKGAG